MNPRPEHRSRLPEWVLPAALLLSLVAPARAQTPTCAWGDGVVIPGTENRKLSLASDGGAGLLVVSCPVNWFDQSVSSVGTLRLHHVLEQGRLDPSLREQGVTFYTPPNAYDYQGTDLARVLADGSGGAYVLMRACNPNLAHTRCWEHSTMRLLHVGGTGTTSPGWPDTGVVIAAKGEPRVLDSGDIVPDGAGGVVAAWIRFDPDSFSTPSVRAQRYSAAGVPLWPGGAGGRELLAPALERTSVRVTGDGAGGVAVAVTGLTAAGRYDVFAGRVLASGTLPWGTAGKIVLSLPGSSSVTHDVAMGASGLLFVVAGQAPAAGGAGGVVTQLLSQAGARVWGALGIPLGPAGPGLADAVLFGDGYVTVHVDDAFVHRLQFQDLLGEPMWGPLPATDGQTADWCQSLLPLTTLPTPDGDLVCLWADHEAVYLGPPTAVHAMELDPAGEIAPGWTASGVELCGGGYGLSFSDAITAAGQIFVAFANEDFPAPTPRVQRLSRTVLAVPPSLPTQALELFPPSPNPSRGSWNARFALREPSPVSLDVYDIAGRRVLSQDLGFMSPGMHTAPAEGSAALAPGIYRIRLRAGAHTAQRILVRLP